MDFNPTIRFKKLWSTLIGPKTEVEGKMFFQDVTVTYVFKQEVTSYWKAPDSKVYVNGFYSHTETGASGSNTDYYNEVTVVDSKGKEQKMALDFGFKAAKGDIIRQYFLKTSDLKKMSDGATELVAIKNISKTGYSAGIEDVDNTLCWDGVAKSLSSRSESHISEGYARMAEFGRIQSLLLYIFVNWPISAFIFLGGGLWSLASRNDHLTPLILTGFFFALWALLCFKNIGRVRKQAKPLIAFIRNYIKNEGTHAEAQARALAESREKQSAAEEEAIEKVKYEQAMNRDAVKELIRERLIAGKICDSLFKVGKVNPENQDIYDQLCKAQQNILKIKEASESERNSLEAENTEIDRCLEEKYSPKAIERAKNVKALTRKLVGMGRVHSVLFSQMKEGSQAPDVQEVRRCFEEILEIIEKKNTLGEDQLDERNHLLSEEEKVELYLKENYGQKSYQEKLDQQLHFN